MVVTPLKSLSIQRYLTAENGLTNGATTGLIGTVYNIDNQPWLLA